MSDLSPVLSDGVAVDNSLSPAMVTDRHVVWDLPGLHYTDALAREPRTVAIVLRVGACVGWYGSNNDKPWLPLDVYRAHYGEPDLTETITQRCSWHFDSGWPDTYTTVPKWRVVGYPRSVDVASLCRDGFEFLDPSLRAARIERETQLAIYTAQSRPYKYKRARVIRGRKIPHGTEGEIFWVGPDKFKRHGLTCGITTASGEKFFTSADNLAIDVHGHWIDVRDPAIPT